MSQLAAPPRTSLAFGLLGATQVLLIAALTLPMIGLPQIQREFGLSAAGMALLTAAYGLAFAGLLLAGGRLADLANGRRMFLFGLGVFALASIAASVATAYPVLLVTRFGQGIGAALVAPAAMVLLGHTFTDSGRRGRALAAWGVLSGIGATAGNLLSGVIVTWSSWRFTFLAPALVAIALLLAGRGLLESRPATETGRRVDVAGAVLVTTGITLLSYGLLQAGERSWTAITAYGPVAAAAALLVAFVLVERRVVDPILPLGFLADTRRLSGVAVLFVTAGGMATMWFMMSLYLQQVRGFSPLLTSAAFAPYGLVQVGTSAAVGRIVVRFGARDATVSGLVVAAVGMGLLSRVGPDTPYIGGFLAGLLIFAAGASIAFSGAMVAATSNVADRQAGLAGGVANMAMEVGPTVGFALLVSLAAAHAVGRTTTAGYAFALGIAALIFLITALAVFKPLINKGEGQ